MIDPEKTMSVDKIEFNNVNLPVKEPRRELQSGDFRIYTRSGTTKGTR